MTSSNFNRQNQKLLNINVFRDNNNLNNQEFMFKFEGTKFLWKELMKLNTELIERSGDMSSLEPYIENILCSRMMSDDIDYLSNEYITQLITLLQFIGQYLIYIQDRLELENQDLRYTINDLQNKIKDSERSEKLYDELKSQNKEKDFIIKTYQKMVKTGYGLSNEIDKNNIVNDENINLKSKKLVQTERKYYPCTICAGKKFKSQKYLDEHIKRRHYDLMDSENEQVKESNFEKKNYKQIFEGRLNDMKIYFENILKNIEENNRFNSLSRKMDNIQNQIIYQNNNNNNRLNSNSNMNGLCAVCGNHLHNMMNLNNMNNINLNNPKKISEGNKNTNEKNNYVNQKYDRKEEININIDYKKNDPFERSKKRSISSRTNKDLSKLENTILSKKEENTIKNTSNINITIQSENKDKDKNKYLNNTLSESIKKEFISNPKQNESNIVNEKKDLFEGHKNDNNSSNNLGGSKKYVNTPKESYQLKASKNENSNNSEIYNEYQNNRIGKNDYIKASNKSSEKGDDKIKSNNNSNNPVINSIQNSGMNDPKDVINSFYKKFKERDDEYKGEIDDYKNIDFPKIYKKHDFKMKIIERLGNEKVDSKRVDKLIIECQPKENENDIEKKYNNCIFNALDLKNIIEDYKKLMKSKNSSISNQNNNISQNLSHNQQSASGNKSISKLKGNNSDVKEKDDNYNNNYKINNNDQTTMSLIKNNMNQTSNPQANPQTYHQNVTIGFDLTNSVNNL